MSSLPHPYKGADPNKKYKKVQVSGANRTAIKNAINKSPSDWGPQALVAAVQQYSRITVTPDEVWTVLNS